MAKDNDEILKANLGAPTADIPNLKKKEEERKKAGAAWSGARAAAGAAAQPAASAGGGLWATISSSLAGLTSTLAGQAAVAAAALLMAGGVGLVGYGLLKGGGAAGGAASVNLGAIKDTLKVREGGADRTQVASRGEMSFAAPGANAKKTAPEAAEKSAAANAAADAAGAAAEQAAPEADKSAPDKLGHNLGGTKLSGSLGGNFQKNIFGGSGSGAPKFNNGLSNLGSMGNKGKLSAKMAGGVHSSAGARSVSRSSSKRGFGQLKMANRMSAQGATGATGESAAAAAAGAFEQQDVAGTLTAAGAMADKLPSITPPPYSGDAPSSSIPTGTDPTVQNMMNQIGDDLAQASKDLKKGQMEVAIGLVLLAISAVLFRSASLTGYPWGAVILAAAIVVLASATTLLTLGAQLETKSHKEAADAGNLSNDLAAMTKDAEQAAAVKECTKQAQADPPTPPDQCQVPQTVIDRAKLEQQDQDAINRVKEEQGQTYQLGGKK